MPATREELQRRSKAYGRERQWVAALAYLPFLVVYGLVHTTFLRRYLPEDKNQQVLVLIGVPLAWLAVVTWLHGRWGPRRHGLACEACGERLVGAAYQTALATGRCARCAAGVVADGPTTPR
jgi:hypothetical protein